MIVLDTNVIAYLFLPTASTKAAETLLKIEPDWAAPILWRSEMRNVLFLYMRKHLISLKRAIQIQTEAESLLSGNEHSMNSDEILRLALANKCSSYDCEFIV